MAQVDWAAHEWSDFILEEALSEEKVAEATVEVLAELKRLQNGEDADADLVEYLFMVFNDSKPLAEVAESIDELIADESKDRAVTVGICSWLKKRFSPPEPAPEPEVAPVVLEPLNKRKQTELDGDIATSDAVVVKKKVRRTLKSKPCYKFQKGQCKYGDTCQYGHFSVEGGEPSKKLAKGGHPFQALDSTRNPHGKNSNPFLSGGVANPFSQASAGKFGPTKKADFKKGANLFKQAEKQMLSKKRETLKEDLDKALDDHLARGGVAELPPQRSFGRGRGRGRGYHGADYYSGGGYGYGRGGGGFGGGRGRGRGGNLSWTPDMETSTPSN
jgi:hypothetical protein